MSSKNALTLAVKLIIRQHIKCDACGMTQKKWNMPTKVLPAGTSNAFFDISNLLGFDDSVNASTLIQMLQNVRPKNWPGVFMADPAGCGTGDLVQQEDFRQLGVEIKCAKCGHCGTMIFCSSLKNMAKSSSYIVPRSKVI